MYYLICPSVSPYHSSEQIESSMEEIRELPESPQRTAALEQLQAWLDCAKRRELGEI